MKNSHTQLPWSAKARSGNPVVIGGPASALCGGWTIVDAKGKSIAACSSGIARSDEEKQANVEHVLRAVNHFDELVAALEAVARDYNVSESEAKEMGWTAVEITVSSLEKVRAVLAKVQA